MLLLLPLLFVVLLNEAVIPEADLSSGFLVQDGHRGDQADKFQSCTEEEVVEHEAEQKD